MPDERTTRTRLLDMAQELAQSRGLNAFSFNDLARGVGIRTASVHHHFPTKTDLARELMARYRENFIAELEAISQRTQRPRRRLDRFVGLFVRTLREGNRLCLCGMLASEYPTLDGSVQAEVRAFYDETEAWLTRAFEDGRRVGELQFDESAKQGARAFLATLEGAMVAARAFGDERRLARSARWLLASIAASRSRAGA